MKTSELTGTALDWAVAVCESYRTGVFETLRPPPFSSEWSLGGPIIERRSIALSRDAFLSTWHASDVIECAEFETEGPTPLIAAMRCYVASELGDEVKIPEELL